MTTLTAAYRRPLFGADDELFNRCLMGSAVAGLVFVIAILIAPIRQQVITHVDQLPPRFAKLILEPPKPRPMPAGEVVRAGSMEPEGGHEGGGSGPVAARTPAPQVSPAPGTGRREMGHTDLPPGEGTVGRARAQQVVSASLASSRASLEHTLGNLSSSLGAVSSSEPAEPVGRRPGRAVRAARSGNELGSVVTGNPGGGGGADLGGSAVRGSIVSIGSLSPGGGGSGSGGAAGGVGYGGTSGSGEGGLGGTGGGGGGTGTGYGTGNGSGNGYGEGTGDGTGTGVGRGSAPGVYRSNASLLATIQKYTAGIQYCYGNELKRDPSLSGKLVVALTVSASGQVVQATIVENTLRAPQLAACALSQIRDWKFPPIPVGVTTFQTPFVFTPPS
jgi:periplasmic protein TonB